MRLHAHEPAFQAALRLRPPGNTESPDILLDGVKQRDVIMADEEAGLVHRYKPDTLGTWIVMPEGEEHETETVRG
jgi:hypothetical protein